MKTIIRYFFATYPSLGDKKGKVADVDSLPSIPCGLGEQLIYQDDPIAYRDLVKVPAYKRLPRFSGGSRFVQPHTQVPNFKWLGALIQGPTKATTFISLDFCNTPIMNWDRNEAAYNNLKLSSRHHLQEFLGLPFNVVETRALYDGGYPEQLYRGVVRSIMPVWDPATGSEFIIRGSSRGIDSKFVCIPIRDFSDMIDVFHITSRMLSKAEELRNNNELTFISLKQFLHKYCRGGFLQYIRTEDNRFLYGSPIAGYEGQLTDRNRHAHARMRGVFAMSDEPFATRHALRRHGHLLRKTIDLRLGFHCPELADILGKKQKEKEKNAKLKWDDYHIKDNLHSFNRYENIEIAETTTRITMPERGGTITDNGGTFTANTEVTVTTDTGATFTTQLVRTEGAVTIGAGIAADPGIVDPPVPDVETLEDDNG